MCVFLYLYRSGVVKKIPIRLPSLFNERCKIKSEVRVPYEYLILLPAPFFHGKRKYEFLHSLNPSSGLTGLEPAASALTGRCSDQLNYNPRGVYGIPILK